MAATISAPRRRNVSPKSTVLHLNVKDVDCSGLTDVPEDGELIVVHGGVAQDFANVLYNHANSASVSASDKQGGNLRMVWGSALRSDRSASGQKRVATFHGGSVEVECKLFEHTGATLGAAGNYEPGSFVTAGKATTAISGSANRLVMKPTADDDAGFAIGTVVSVSQNTGVATAGDSVRVRLYDAPRKMNDFA